MRLASLQRLVLALSSTIVTVPFWSATGLSAQAPGPHISGSSSSPISFPQSYSQGAERLQLVALNLTAPAAPPASGESSSSIDEKDVPDSPDVDQRYERGATGRNKGRIPRDPNYGHIGAALSIGASGLTGDVAFPINRFFDVRLGASGFRYSHTFPEQFTDVQGTVQIAYGKAQVDFYPFAGHLRISPMLAFANYSHGIAAFAFAGGETFDLEDGTFTSSPTDPVHGSGRVDFRHTAPGLTIGLNNFTRGYGRFTFPVEIGAIYVGQPKLVIDFAGTACNSGFCERVQDDADFQTQLAAVRTRINDDLHRYAQFLPVLNVGVGYRF